MLMKKSTIDGIIDTFDESYHKNKNDLYLKHKSVDMFIALSQNYAEGLSADNYEKEVFMSYFKDHVTSMYRRDFEPILLDAEKNSNAPKEHHKILGNAFWGAVTGVGAGLFAYVLSKNIYASIIAGVVGGYGGLKLFNIGMKDSEPLRLSRIVGTKEYEKQIRNTLSNSLSDG
jgi:hypothetical protein